MTILINIPKPDEVIAEMKSKGLSAYRIAKDTYLSTETVSRFLNGSAVSVRSIERISEFVNNYKNEK